MLQQQRRWRDRWFPLLFPLLTLFVAVGWAYTGWHQAAVLREANSARSVAHLLTGGMGLGQALPQIGGVAATSTLSGVRSPLTDLQQSTGTVETVVDKWQCLMYGIAGAVALLAVASWVTSCTRATHLVAAAIMLIGTVATLIGMRIVEHPQFGNMPPLPRYQYVLAGVVLSAYAWVLLAVFAWSGRSSRATIQSSS